MLFIFLYRGTEGILLQIWRGEGVYGDAGSGYEEIEVREACAHRCPITGALSAHRCHLFIYFS